MTTPQYPYIVYPSSPVIGVWDSGNGGEFTATLPGAIFVRKLTAVSINCSAPASANLYWNFIDPLQQFDTTPVGSQNTADYPNPRTIPPNTSVVVQWTAVGGIASTASASAIFFTERAN